MEWEEIYGTNPSRVLKTLASGRRCCHLPLSLPLSISFSLSFAPLSFSFLCHCQTETERERETGRANQVRLPKRSVMSHLPREVF